MSRIGAAALAAVLVLSLPAPALAQSAGDEQYRDPFAGQDEGAGNEGDAAPAPAPAPTTTTAPAESTATDPEPVATTAGSLPRTGSAAAWVAGFGLLLIAAGAGLRRTART
jgi:LPXTG-motif cell wall-anchored protein